MTRDDIPYTLFSGHLIQLVADLDDVISAVEHVLDSGSPTRSAVLREISYEMEASDILYNYGLTVVDD